MIAAAAPAIAWLRRIALGAALVAAFAALSLAWYSLMYVLAAHGRVQFYVVWEHAGMVVYCLGCYAACRICDRALGPRRWLALIASYGVAVVATVVLATALRVVAGAPIRVMSVVVNVPLVLLMFHSIIAGTYFAARHIGAVAAGAAAERAAIRAELGRLRQQVDPHFLFNNLNILTALVRQSPDEAERFGYHLARLYRDLLRHTRAEWVTLEDELGFVESYLHVLSARFGAAYRLSTALPRDLRYFVIPGALQELLENVVKHNHASDDAPIDIELRVEADTLFAENTIRRKQVEAPASGQGLAILDERYRLQLGRAVEWRVCDGRFRVSVPLVTEL